MARQRVRRLAGVPLLIVAVAGGAALLPGCSRGDDGWPADKPGPRVVVSFAPLYCFVTNVAGDDAIVRNLLTTTGPHHFNPTDKDARLLRRADLFFLNGLGLEGDKPEAMKRGSGNKQLKLIALGDKIPADKLFEGSCQHEGEDHAGREHDIDPHVWLSPDQAVLLVEGIRDELKAIDPANTAGYEKRAKEYSDKLRKLKDDGIALLKDKKDRRIVTFHDSMTYFAKSFDLQIVGVVQKNPGTEPTGTQLTKLLALCADETNPVRVICAEPQYGNSSSGQEVIKLLKHKKVPDPVLVELDPLETVPPDELNPGWYEAKMRANLEALARAMR